MKQFQITRLVSLEEPHTQAISAARAEFETTQATHTAAFRAAFLSWRNTEEGKAAAAETEEFTIFWTDSKREGVAPIKNEEVASKGDKQKAWFQYPLDINTCSPHQFVTALESTRKYISAIIGKVRTTGLTKKERIAMATAALTAAYVSGNQEEIDSALKHLQDVTSSK